MEGNWSFQVGRLGQFPPLFIRYVSTNIVYTLFLKVNNRLGCDCPPKQPRHRWQEFHPEEKTAALQMKPESDGYKTINKLNVLLKAS